jgi:hypothetical protein
MDLAGYERDTRDLDDLKKFEQSHLQTQNTMEKTVKPVYKIFNIKDLLAELNFEGRGKGSKTEDYLESVFAEHQT